jgi:hypothetical protein
LTNFGSGSPDQTSLSATVRLEFFISLLIRRYKAEKAADKLGLSAIGISHLKTGSIIETRKWRFAEPAAD